MAAAAFVFLGTYLVLALGQLPGFPVDRTGAAIIGASLMIGFNVLTLDDAYASIGHNTIILLFGMMLVVANLLTVLGSVANLIVLHRAKRHVVISFWEYFRVGLPLTVLTIAVGVLLLQIP